MDELPELLVEAVGGEAVLATVDLSGGDIVAVTTPRTYVYRSEGLLSDESVATYGHDVERFATDAGRRKTTLRLRNLDDEESFAVPASTVDDVVAAMLEAMLRTDGVLADDETVETQFRFSELTLVVTDRKLLKHIGSAVWDDEFEAYRYEDLGGLDFEEGSVATQVVLETDGRQQRVKVPNDHAGRVRQAVQTSVFEYHGVSSLGGLCAAVADDEEADDADGSAEAAPESASGVEAETVVADAGSEAAAEAEPEQADADDGFVSADWSPPADQDVSRSDDGDAEADTPGGATTADAGASSGTGAASVTDVGSGGDGPTDIEGLAERVDALSERVKRQTELIEAQQETIEQLVEELRRGR